MITYGKLLLESSHVRVALNKSQKPYNNNNEYHGWKWGRNGPHNRTAW